MSRRRGPRPDRRPVAALLLAVLVTVLLLAGPVAGGTGLALAAAPGDPGQPVVISTVPAVAGFPITLDGVTVPTGPDGKARFDHPTGVGDLAPRITLQETELPIGGQQVKVSADRFYASTTDPTVALNLSYLVQFSYTDQQDGPVDASKVGEVRLKSVTGQVVRTPAQQPVWLQGSRVVKESSGLIVKDLSWSFQEVRYGGSNVVNASQQQFLPAHQQQVIVRLLFFHIRLAVHDALFGFPTADAVEIVAPDGSRQRYPLDEEGRVTLPRLPRGDYTLTIIGAGPRLDRPIAVSRDLDVTMAFHSWLDAGTVVGTIVALAVGLALIGRRRRRRTAGPPAPSPGSSVDVSAEPTTAPQTLDTTADRAMAPGRPGP
jgi:hypothetical protein